MNLIHHNGNPQINLFQVFYFITDESEPHSRNINRDNLSNLNQSKTDLSEEKSCDKTNTTGGDLEKPWQTLVSYVDELTVGGRRNSKGQFVDGMGSFIGFGKKKKPRIAPDCFPSNFYEKLVFLFFIKLIYFYSFVFLDVFAYNEFLIQKLDKSGHICVN